jgi:hypothetical protein
MHTSLNNRPILVPKGLGFTKQYVKDSEVNRDAYIWANSGGFSIENMISTQIQPSTTYIANKNVASRNNFNVNLNKGSASNV